MHYCSNLLFLSYGHRRLRAEVRLAKAPFSVFRQQLIQANLRQLKRTELLHFLFPEQASPQTRRWGANRSPAAQTFGLHMQGIGHPETNPTLEHPNQELPGCVRPVVA